MQKDFQIGFVAGAVSRARWLLPCLGLLMMRSTAEAQTVVAPSAPVRPAVATSDARPLHRVSLTFSTLHLIGPALQLTAEFRLHPRLSAASIAGFGRLGRDSGFEYGGQFRAYVLGGFDHGLGVGAEVLYRTGVTFLSGLYLNPFVGYKFVAAVGFTIDLRVGARIHAIRAFEQEDSRLSALLAVNLGWSF